MRGRLALILLKFKTLYIISYLFPARPEAAEAVSSSTDSTPTRRRPGGHSPLPLRTEHSWQYEFVTLTLARTGLYCISYYLTSYVMSRTPMTDPDSREARGHRAWWSGISIFAVTADSARCPRGAEVPTARPRARAWHRQWSRRRTSMRHATDAAACRSSTSMCEGLHIYMSYDHGHDRDQQIHWSKYILTIHLTIID